MGVSVTSVPSAPGGKAIQVEYPPCAIIDPGDGTKARLRETVGVVIHAEYVPLLKPVNPEDQTAVIRAGSGGRPPFDFQRVRCVGQDAPGAGRPDQAVVRYRPAQPITVARTP